MTLRLATRVPFLVIGAIISAIVIDFQLSLIFLISTGLILLSMWLITRIAVRFYRLLQSKLDKITTIIRENVVGIRVIKAFSRHSYEKEKFQTSAEDYQKNAISVGKWTALLNPITFLILNFSTIILVHFGGISVNLGNITQGEFTALVNYLAMILLAVVNAVNMMPIVTKAFASGKRVSEILETPVIEKSKEKENQPNLNLNLPIIEYKNVGRTYENSPEPAVKNVSFSLNKGENLGIIGGTGSGKSTLVQLLLRFYDVTEGEITICGNKIENFNREILSEKIGYVQQKTSIFSGTVADNLRIGKPNATEEEIISALKISQSWDFVEKMPNGINTVISQNSLSGGQKQRISIARVIIRNPEILILDDSASALDFNTENALMERICKVFKDKTIIVITQREHTLKWVDKVIRLDN
jgi:ATP-binding cassette subfamily B protein